MTATAFPKNPYIIGRPIHDSANFYGREEIFQFIEDNLENQSQVILLFGQRRIGKTSILKQIPQAVNLENFVFVPLSLQGKSHKSLGEVLLELATDIKDSIQDYFKTSEVDIPLPSVSDLKKNSNIFVNQFLAQIYNILKSKNLVLLIDEFDVLEDTNKDSAINKFFPYLYSILPQQKQLYIIPVVGRRLDDMPTLLSLFKETPYKQIGLLDRNDAKQLICQPTEGILNYDANAIQAIVDLSAGHPYFTQLICFAIFGRLRQQQRHDVTKEDVTEIVDKAIEYGEGGLAWFYDGLTKPERLIFSVIAEVQKYKNTDIWQFLKQQKVGKNKSLITANKQLLSWEFIKQEWEYIPAAIQIEKITVELVRLWLLKRHPAGQEIKSYQTWLRDRNKLRRYLPGGVAALTLIFGGAIGWWYSPWGQIQQTRWDLVDLSDRVSNDVAIDTAVAFAKDNKSNQAIKLLGKKLESANQIGDSLDKTWALSAIAKAYGELKQSQKGIALLQEALESAKQMDDSRDKTRALIAISEAIGELKQSPEGIKLLQQALQFANQIDDLRNKTWALIAIAEAIGELKQSPEGIKLLQQALQFANQIDDSDYSYDKSRLLTPIAKAFGEFKQLKEGIATLQKALKSAEEIDDPILKAEALKAISETISEFKQTNEENEEIIPLQEELKSANQKAIESANRMEDLNFKARALSVIAQVYGNLAENSEAINTLEQALDSVNQSQFKNSDFKAFVLEEISKTYGNLAENSEAIKSLEQSANQNKDSEAKAWMLIALAEAYGNLGQNPEAINILQQALDAANQIQDSYDKARVLRAIAEAYGNLEQNSEAINVLQQALDTANQIQDSNFKASVLSAIAEAYAKQGKWNQARKIIDLITVEDIEAEALAEVLTIWAENKNPALAEKE